MISAALLDLLACPDCHDTLVEGDGVLRCTSCDRTYPIRDGRPVFIDDPDSVEIRPVDHISNSINDDVEQWIAGHDGFVLHLGAGATDVRFDNCVEGEYAIFRNTDVALDAHKLPFRDDAFAGVLTLNTFEHLRDPPTAAAELLRVMRPGADIWLQTAWLQPLHEAPVHFYGATEFGLREWFEGLDIEAVTVPGNMNPGFALSWITGEILGMVEHHLGPDVRAQLGSLTLDQVAEFWANPDYLGPFWASVVNIPEIAQRHAAAGFELRGRKPGA